MDLQKTARPTLRCHIIWVASVQRTGSHAFQLGIIQAKEIASIPFTYLEIKWNLGMFGTLLEMVLGNQRILMTADRKFWD